MANVKITELTAATALASTDVLPIVDVGADATKKVSVSDLLRNLPDGTASAPALAFADDQNTGVLSPAANELAFATSGTQRLVIDSSGNVGIGAASPNQKLHLNASGSGGNKIKFTNDTTGVGASDGFTVGIDGSENAELRNDESTNMLFITSGSERLRIDSSGKVGIGTTSPTGLLDVIGSSFSRFLNSTAPTLDNNTHAGEALFLRSGGSSGSGNVQAVLALGKADSGSQRTGAAIGSIQTDSDADKVGLSFYTSPSSSSSQTLSEKLRITHDGNVGIGTTSPSDLLEINPTSTREGLTIKTTGTTFGGINIDTNRTGAGQTLGDIRFMWDGTGVAGITGHTGADTTNKDNGRLIFNTAAAGSAIERMRIDSSGNVGIGTSSPQHILHLHRVDSGANYLQITNSTTGSGSSDGCLVGVNAIEDVILWQREDKNIQFGTNDAERMRVDNNGRLLVGATSGRNVGGGANALVQVETTSQNAISFVSHRGASTSGSILVLGKSRGTAAGSSTVVASGDELGAIRFAGADGTDVESRAASIAAFVDGTPGANDMPGRLIFSTSADGANVPTERMRIDSSGNAGIGTTSPNSRLTVRDNRGNLGSTKQITADFRRDDGGSNPRLEIRHSNEGSDIHHTYSTGAGALTISTGGVERARFISGGGITFNGDTAQTNALDDYEEGDWTPAAFDNSNGASTQVNRARYTKIGNRVCFECYIRVTKGTNGSSNNYEIHGLPYNSNSADSYHAGVAVSYFSGWSTSISMIQGTVQRNSDHVLVRAISGTSNTGTVTAKGSFLGATTELIIGGTYEVA